MSGDEGPVYVVESSAAVAPANWLPLATNLSPPFIWSHPATNGAKNLYRARLAP